MKYRIVFIVLALLFRALLDLSYCEFISPYYSYARLAFEESTPLVIMFSYLLILGTACFVPLKKPLPSNFMIGFLYFISYIPTTSLMAFGGFPISPLLWLTGVFMFLFFLPRIKIINVGSNFSYGHRPEILLIFVLGICILGYFTLFIEYGLRFPTSIIDIYDVRTDYKESVKIKGVSTAYILSWVGNIVTPFILAWALCNRSVAVFLISLFGQIYLFAIAGFKSQFFAFFFIIWIFAGIRYFHDKLLNYLACSLVIFIIVNISIDYFSNGFFMNAVFTRRIFFVPAQLYYHYYDFFSQNPYTFLSQSKPFNWILEYPYYLPVPNLIAKYFFSAPDMSANANMWADAYANLGIAGMFLFTFMLSILMNLINNISKDKNIYYIYALLAMPLFSLTNTALLTTLLTHGMMLSIILIILLPKQYVNNARQSSYIMPAYKKISIKW